MADSIKGMNDGSIGAGSSSPIEPIRSSTAVSPGGGEAAPAAQQDSVHITQSARSMATLAQAVKDTPDIDTGRVTSAQQAIDSGSYTIQPGRIASRLLQLEQDLGNASK